MKKLGRFALFAIFTLVLVVSTCLLVSCDDGNNQGSNFKVTIHQNNGKADIVWDINDDVPSITKDGFHVGGFYLDENMTISTTLESLKTTGLTKNIDVYVKWEENVCNHVEVVDEMVAPTCTAFGLTEGKHCSKCGKVLQEQIKLPALGHIGGIFTCTEQATCIRCHEKYGKPLGHDYSTEWTVDVPATCTQNGSKSHHCTRCTDKKDVTEIAAGHVGGQATCVDKAVCEVCHEQYGEPLGHDYQDKVCTRCGEHYSSRGLKYVLNDDGNSYTVQGVATRTDTDLIILAIYKGKPVTSIGDDAFRDCTSLTSITIPDSVTRIGSYAFLGCSGLTSITVAQGNTKYHSAGNCLIETESKTLIAGCKTSVIPTDGSVTIIGSEAFRGCSGLLSITIPDSVMDIGRNAFLGCSGLTSITVAQGNTKYHSAGNCLIETESKTLIAGCKTSVIPTDGSVTIIGSEAFRGCSGLLSITIPDSVMDIGRNAFLGCSGLTSITVAQGNTKYHSAGNCLIETESKTLIAGCKTSVIPTDGSVTIIGSEAFRGCSGLLSITIPDSVMDIGRNAFLGCSGLTSITVAQGNTKYHSAGNCLIETESKTLIAGCKTSVIPTDGSVTIIGSEAFRGCSGLLSITIPDSVMDIGRNAFLGCSGLTSITVAQGNTKYHSAGNCLIETESKTLIAGCKTSVIPTDGSVTIIGHFAFYGCRNLTSITIPDSVTSIRLHVFYDCSGLTSITYKGTTKQWRAISKLPAWNKGLPSSCKIVCTDGTIAM